MRNSQLRIITDFSSLSRFKQTMVVLHRAPLSYHGSIFYLGISNFPGKHHWSKIKVSSTGDNTMVSIDLGYEHLFLAHRLSNFYVETYRTNNCLFRSFYGPPYASYDPLSLQDFNVYICGNPNRSRSISRTI